jgi:hypothetical protein
VNITIKNLIGHGHFFQKTFLNANSFISFCKARDIDISLEKLERLEEAGVFLPMLRVKWPKIKIKTIVRSDDETEENLGILQDDERWDGQIREEKAAISWWDPELLNVLIEDGLIWIPTAKEFKPWSSYKDDEGWWDVESYYSIFQTLPLFKFIESTNLTLGIERIASWTRDDTVKWFEMWEPHAKRIVATFSDGTNAFDEAAQLCQELSARYLPYAQADGILISIPHPEFFDWDKFRRGWNAKEFLNELGESESIVADRWQTVSIQAQHVDPFDNWTDLIQFVKRDKKDRLKGRALLGQTWWTMERMLNLFHEDLTGQKRYEFEASPEDKELFYGEGVPKNDLRFLEFLSNQYGVNPRPKLILVVEGDGEEEQVPRIAEEVLPPSFPKVRIGVMNIKGIGELPKLERLIDHYHSLQTIVFVVLDNENNAESRKKKLVNATSKWNPRRTVTKEEYIHLWDKNIEFDNFTDEEIADAMTRTSIDRFAFTKEQIAECRTKFGHGHDPLSTLYQQTFDYDLPKREMLKNLFDMAVASAHMIVNGTKTVRPVVDVIITIKRLAFMNHQPSDLEAWKETQDSDWLGNQIKPMP